MKAEALFDLPESLAPFAGFFKAEARPWEWVTAITEALASADLQEWTPRADQPAALQITGPVHIDQSVTLPAYGSITGPCWIGPGCELRPGLYIRGKVIAGANCVLGNSCEYKNCLLLDHVQSPHFNYVGDSVLGNHAHLGAGAVLSNLRFDQRKVRVAVPDASLVDTGMRKLGALMGDESEVGCNAVLQPGAMLCRRAVVMGSVAFNGTLSADKIAYVKQSVTTIPRRH